MNKKRVQKGVLIAAALLFGALALFWTKPVKTEAAGHVHCVCGATTVDAAFHTCEEHTFTEWTTADSLPNTTGYYYLATDVSLTAHVGFPNGANVVLCLNGHKVKTNGARVYSDYYSSAHSNDVTLTITDCRKTAGIVTNTRQSNENNTGGLFWFIGNNDTVNIYNGTFMVDRADYTTGISGGMFHFAGDSSLNFYGGTIKNGRTTSYGGNIYFKGTGVFNMYGGTITGGYAAKNGGSVHLAGGTMVMYGGAIENGVTGDSGGNLAVQTDATFIMKGGVIQDGTGKDTNKNYNSANVFVHGNGTQMYLEGGTIKGRVNIMGAAEVGFAGTPVIHDGEYGLTVSNTNTAVKSQYLKIGTPDKDRMEKGADIYIISFNRSGNTNFKYQAGDSAEVLAMNAEESDAQYFTVSDTASNSVPHVVNGKILILKVKSHCVCGGTLLGKKNADGTDHVCKNVTWTAYGAADTFNMPTTSGYYYLDADFTNTTLNTVTDGAEIHLDLNGHKITSTALRLYTTYNSSTKAHVSNITWTICDTSGNAGSVKIDRTTSDQGCCIWGAATNSSSLTIYGGQYYISNITYKGGITKNGAMFAFAGKTATMILYDGIIRGGVAQGNGGNLYMNGTGHSFIMMGGEISGGQALPYVSDTTYGGGSGGNIFVENGTVKLLGGVIKDGTATPGIKDDLTFHGGVGGNVFISTAKDVVFGDVTIEGGTAYRGGNVYFGGSGKRTLTNTKILNGKAVDTDFIVYINGSTEKTTKTAEGAANNIYHSNGTTLLKDAKVMGNAEGDSIQANDGSFKIESGEYEGSFNFLKGGEIYGGFFTEKPFAKDLKTGYSPRFADVPSSVNENVILKYEVIQGYMVLTTSLVEGTDDTISATFGGNAYKVGDKVTIGTEPVTGYLFKGWYTQADDGTLTAIPGAADFTYTTSSLTASTTFVALFAADDSLVRVDIYAPGFTFKVDNGSMSAATNAHVGNYKKGTKITVQYANADKRLLSWTNDSNKILSREDSYTFTVATTTVITGNTEFEVEDVIAVLLNDRDQVVKSFLNETVTADKIPAPAMRYGKTFKGYTVGDDTTVLSLDEMIAKVALLSASEALIEIKQNYENDTDTITVTVKSATTEGVRGSESFYEFKEIETIESITALTTSGITVSVKDSLITGEKFAGAVLKIGDTWQTLSTETDFIFRPGKDVTVYALYGKNTEESVPSIAMTLADAMEQTDGRFTYIFTVSRNVSASFTVLEQGLVFVTDGQIQKGGAAAANEACFLDSGKGTVYKSNNMDKAGHSTLNAKNVADGNTFMYARGYMVVADSDGHQETYYTGLMYGSAYSEFELYENDVVYAKAASTETEMEIGAKDTTVKLHITTDDENTPPHNVLISSDNAKIVASWTSAKPFDIMVYGTEVGTEGLLSIVADGILLPEVHVTVKAHKHAVATLSHIAAGEGTEVEWLPWTDETKVPTAAGHYYLETDIVTSGIYYVADNSECVICFNGHTITYNGTTRLYSSLKKTGQTLTLCDCKEEGGIVCDSHPGANQGTAVWLTSNSTNTLNIYGGTIAGGENYLSDASNGGLVAAQKGTVNMYGGVIENGKSTRNGANLCLMETAVGNLYGGEIRNGYIHSGDKYHTYGANVYIAEKAVLNVEKGMVIRDGQAPENVYAAIATTGTHQGHGANIAVRGGTLNVNGGILTGGITSVVGGNIYIVDDSTNGNPTNVTLTDAEISNGSAWAGGGIYHQSGNLTIAGTTTITGNVFSSTDTTARGAGIYFGKGNITLTGSPVIYDNTGKKDKAQNNLSIPATATITVKNLNSDAKIGVSTVNDSPFVMQTRVGFANTDKDYTENFIPDAKTSFSVKYAASKLDIVEFESELKMGFARVDITPTWSVPLAGYGRTWTRMSTNVLDDSYLTATCIAVTGKGGTILMYTIDAIRAAYVDEVRTAVNAETGIPKSNILITATHSHSAPDVSFSNSAYPEANEAIKRYKTFFVEQLTAAALEALEDQTDVVTTYTGDINAEFVNSSGKTVTMNNIRHYTLKDQYGNYAGVKGDNFNQLYNKSFTGKIDSDGDIITATWVDINVTISGHTTQADSSIRINEFTRKNKEPIVLVNWRSHPHMTGGSAKTDISADLISYLRKEVEEKTGFKCAYFQGASGNINPKSSISGETYSSDYKAYGRKMGSFVVTALNSRMKEIENDGTIQIVSENYEGLIKNKDYYTEEEVAAAQKIADLFTRKGNSNTLYEMCRQTGNMVHSAYDASSIVSKSKLTASTTKIPIYAFRIGNLAFTEAPYEMFDTNSLFIRENGLDMGYDNVFVLAYSNGSESYVPSKIGFTQGTDTLFGSYEGDQCKFRPIQYYVDAAGNHYDKQNAAGTLEAVYVGEDLANHFVNLLKGILPAIKK